jgi:hypothetical protein
MRLSLSCSTLSLLHSQNAHEECKGLHPLSLDRLMRVGEESHDPMVEIRSWAIEINGGDLMSFKSLTSQIFSKSLLTLFLIKLMC